MAAPASSSASLAAADSLCVFCGSSPGNDPAYAQLAGDVGRAIAQNGWRMVYGGGQKGLMGILADSALASNGQVLGVIPSVMTSSAPSGHPTDSSASKEGQGPSTQVHTHPNMHTEVVSSMHERKALMARESGRGFVGLPGGYGTFEEVLEMVTWSQLGIHNVPIVLPNVRDFWGPLEQLVQSAAKSGFITEKGLDLLYVLHQKEVDAEHGGDWGKATLAAVGKMEAKLRGRQGYWAWSSNGSTPSRPDFSSAATAISVRNLTYSFQPHLPASLHNINLTLPQGSRTLLIGANGAGKSTLLRLLAGKRLVSNKSGTPTPITVFDRDVFNSPPSGITYLGTEWAMNPVVRSDIVVDDFLNSVGGYRYKARRDRLLDLLDVDLDWHMHAISDGERRRVQLCMGLMAPWTVLLLDEVTVDLDVQVRSDLLAFLKEEAEERGATIVYATHIFDGLHDFPSHVVHMRLGEVVDESGPNAQAAPSLLWPPSDSDMQRLRSSSASAARDSKDGVLLNIALDWLRADRKLREEREAAAGDKGKQRGARKGLGKDAVVESDSEKFYTRYDYSQTVMR
ncbi:hypothetical protein BDZ90DRAFT_279311 [Jaminaea rosea]|uniref:ABC transporter domain-containing protein n=1 Tax=Jaminaea rosea TaxID=1569628 RepID=A0A316USA7_9BASI|nr:hypothetical protein BDZ90DRAFT_279311 [Jaminaea rosea]PWN28189.1 hypothetical protein BDZ90DRAFT_279311 [Jaminaea rosea]